MAIQVFISYKSEYRDFARSVKGQLNQWGYDTWLDVDNIQPGDYFRHKIQQGLDSSDVLLMVLTEEAQLSREVMSEVDYFLDVAKKPVVPLRHRECKPLYIFVSIQYIDFVTNQDTGFVQLRHRLTELASTISQTSAAREEISIVPQVPGATAILDAVGGGVDLKSEEQAASDRFGELAQAPEPQPVEKEHDEVELEKSAQQETEKKESLEDGLFDLAPMQPASEAPKPPPAPQPLSMNQPALPPTPPAQPATMPYQAERQPAPMAQPAPVGRKSRSPILWSLAAVASLVIVVGAVLLFGTSANVSSAVPPQPQGTSPLVWVVAIAVVGSAGFIGWRRFGRSSTVPNAQMDATNRMTMLQKVDDFWLKGVLDPALEAGTLDIGQSSAPGAILRHKDYGDYELPPNANILDVFIDLNRELLILGAPGGGKTVLLLQLARELINQANHPHPSVPSPSERGEEPIPVVFNLSSWAAERKPLADWLVDELRQKYQVPKNVATAWVEGEKLLLLLDGLDEVDEDYQNECVDTINRFRREYRLVDLAVCSRLEAYNNLTKQLDVRGAVVLESLSQTIIDKYLERPELTDLHEVLAKDAELRRMATAPFLLNAMVYAYVGITRSMIELPNASGYLPQRKRWKLRDARLTHLFDRWVEKHLEAKPTANYVQSKVRKWLGWLTFNMVEFDKTIFYIEELQPDWIVERTRRYRLGLAIPGGIVVGLASVLIGGPVFALIAGVFTGIFLFFGSINMDIWLAEIVSWRISIEMVAVLVGFIAFFQIGLLRGIPPAQVAFIVISALTVIIILGLQVRESVSNRNRPNQGIRQSLYNSIRVSVAFSITFNVVLNIALWLGIQLDNGAWQIILAAQVIIPLAGFLLTGGFAVFQHIVLRIVLFGLGDSPWNYTEFLDYCVSAGLMRKVGGGYIFAHRYLLEYFAESYSE